MARPYRLGRREATKAETRERLIASARDLLIADGPDVSMEAVARRAGLTRATIYLHFGSRREVFLAVLNEALDRADVRAVRKGLQHRDPATAARLMLRGSCRFWGSEYELFRRVKAFAGVDNDFAELDRLKEGVRRGHIENLATRLGDAGQLRIGVSRERACELLVMLSSFEVFQHLHVGGRLGIDAVGGELVALADGRVLGATAGQRRAAPAARTA